MLQVRSCTITLIFKQAPKIKQIMKHCEYCKGNCEDGALKCLNCGAPTESDDLQVQDYRSCPYCSRKLLALASPACNYCGRRLPEEYIKARESDLNRIIEIEDGENSKRKGDVDEASGRGARRKRSQSSSHNDLIDLTILTDLFS
jgi:DNA-directed RNA polymerase subunit RPC12/RpoP